MLIRVLLAIAIGLLAARVSPGAGQTATQLNISYDPTRDLYQEGNTAFAKKSLADPGSPQIEVEMPYRESRDAGRSPGARVHVRARHAQTFHVPFA